MLLCFGAAWPFSVVKSYRSRQNAGKSLTFLVVIFIGYVAGVIHKVLFSYDLTTALYACNGILVLTDLALYFRNWRLTHVAAGTGGPVRGAVL
jgi:hypothetical protein